MSSKTFIRISLYTALLLSFVPTSLFSEEAAPGLPEPFAQYVTERDVSLVTREQVPEFFAWSKNYLSTSCESPYIDYKPKEGLLKRDKWRGVQPFPLSCEGSEEGRSLSGEEVLWNQEAHWWRDGHFTSNGQIKVWRQDGEERKFQFQLQRVYPQYLDTFPENQFFREQIEIYGGNRERALRWMTFRLFGSSEDLVWSYSPLIDEVRRVTGVNREDSLFGTGVAVDDLLFFSRKFGSLKVVDLEESIQLVPFATSRLTNGIQRGEGCVEVRPTTFRRAQVYGYRMGVVGPDVVVRHLQEEQYYPRSVVTLVLESEDPYFTKARHILVVDKELQFPVYIISYNVLGKLQRSAFQVLGMAKYGDGADSEIYPAVKKAVTYDHINGSASEVTFYSKSWCPVTKEKVDKIQPLTFGARGKGSAKPDKGKPVEEIDEESPI